MKGRGKLWGDTQAQFRFQDLMYDGGDVEQMRWKGGGDGDKRWKSNWGDSGGNRG